MHSQETIKKCKLLPNFPLLWVTSQVGRFAKQKSNLMTIWSSQHTLNLRMGKIPNWTLEQYLAFLQQSCFSSKT